MNIDEEIQIQLDQSEAAVMLERVGINFPTDVSERALQYLVAEYSAKVIHSRYRVNYVTLLSNLRLTTGNDYANCFEFREIHRSCFC